MPLPAALAARLARRGIIAASQAKPPSGDDEEVIAEDYDEQGTADLQQNNIINRHSGKLVTEDTTAGHLGCPNKWNVYHECTEACARQWGSGRDPEPQQEARRLQMLERYPLPPSWSEVYDPGTGRYYYWSVESEMVSWLPPGHPRAMPGACAAALRLQIQLLEQDKLSSAATAAAAAAAAAQHSKPDRDGAPAGSDEERDRSPDRQRDRERGERGRARDRDQRRERAGARRDARRADRDAKPTRKKDDLDPMDPAAYSDVPRGSWSSGLERDVKTGVDSTASGPLFQQRPYPSPGAVLRANAAKGAGAPPPPTDADADGE